jgi:hypothetical protein
MGIWQKIFSSLVLILAEYAFLTSPIMALTELF